MRGAPILALGDIESGRADIRLTPEELENANGSFAETIAPQTPHDLWANPECR
jgi:hypothetical protein